MYRNIFSNNLRFVRSLFYNLFIASATRIISVFVNCGNTGKDKILLHYVQKQERPRACIPGLCTHSAGELEEDNDECCDFGFF